MVIMRVVIMVMMMRMVWRYEVADDGDGDDGGADDDCASNDYGRD